jgi:hypothetical protein
MRLDPARGTRREGAGGGRAPRSPPRSDTVRPVGGLLGAVAFRVPPNRTVAWSLANSIQKASDDAATVIASMPRHGSRCDAASYNRRSVEASHFDERSFFSAVHTSGVRALLIGRRALVLLGLPLLTADYDYWIAIDDIERFNALAAAFQQHPTRTAADARRHGRYVLENDEHIDVLVARSVPTLHGLPVDFEGLWTRRQTIDVGTVPVCIPSLDDLILTKQIASRPKDLEDVRLLRILKESPR